MELIKLKKPFYGLEKYLHFIILGLSIWNIFYYTTSSFNFDKNIILSLLISIFGMIIFYFKFFNKIKIFNLLALLWTLPQLFHYQDTNGHIFDLSQGTSFEITYLQDSIMDGIYSSQYFAINAIAILILGILIFKVKNKYLYQNYFIIPASEDELKSFVNEIEEVFSFGKNNSLIVFKKKINEKKYAIKVENPKNLTNKDDMIYEISNNAHTKDKFKPIELRQITKGKITIA